MKVNFIAISGRIYNENIEVYTKSGQKYHLYTIYIGFKSWLKIISKNPIPTNNEEEILIFGKIVNLYNTISILVVEHKKLSKQKTY